MRPIAYILPLLLLPSLPASAMMVRPTRACPMIAKLCPDGSSVSPTGPNCEFAPCPGGKQPVEPKTMPVLPTGGGTSPGGAPGAVPGSTGEGESGEGNAEPGTVTASPEPQPPSLPDEPLEAPKGAQSVKFVVEHRTALNDQHVTVHGIVVSALLHDKACRARPGMCAQPRITIADSADATRNKAYDVEVILPDGDKTVYAQGQIVDLTVSVSGSEGGVVLEKEEP